MTIEPLDLAGKSIVLVGLMGAGKSSVGRLLAKQLHVPFIDSDDEVEKAAGCSIQDIFDIYGEPAFRDVEERVIERLLNGPAHVLATGGGAFMNPRTRARIAEQGMSVWLHASLDALVKRTQRRGGRPLLEGTDHRQRLAELSEQRNPTYELADIIVKSGDEQPDVTTHTVLRRLKEHMADTAASATGRPTHSTSTKNKENAAP